MKDGSMLESAARALSLEGKEMKFFDLWEKVKADLEITPEEEEHRIGRFYTDLSLSGEFVVLGENIWDLRSRHTYEKVHIDVGDVYTDVEQRDNDATDEEEEKEYDQAMKGGINTDDEDVEEDPEAPESKPRENAADLLGLPSDNY